MLKRIKDEYRNSDAVVNLVNYVLDKKKMPSNIWGGNGVWLANPAESMYMIKKAFDKTTGKQVEHVILAFSKKEQNLLCPSILVQIASSVCSFFNCVQVVYAVHEIKSAYFTNDVESTMHIHFVINTVNIETGKKFRIEEKDIYYIKSYIEAVLRNLKVSKGVYLVN